MKKTYGFALTLVLAASLMTACRDPELPMSTTRPAVTTEAPTEKAPDRKPAPAHPDQTPTAPHASGAEGILPRNGRSYREF